MKYRWFTEGKAIKEAFDNLPSGVCFFTQGGLPVLCNYTMHRLAFELIGQDLQSLHELKAALKDLPDGVTAAVDGETLVFPDGNAWQFSFAEAVDGEGAAYIEAIASNVTDLYRAAAELAQNNARLEKMAERTRQITENIAAIAREEEILDLKMRVHGDVGSSVLNTRQYFIGGCRPEAKAELLEQWRKTVGLLHNKAEKREKADDYAELIKLAAAIGVEIVQTGRLPEDSLAAELITAAVRECLTNAVRHAGSDRLFVAISQDEVEAEAVITNNGQAPKREITEGGGLSSLRTRVEKAGGAMRLKSLPQFSLTVTVPLKGDAFI